MKVVLTVAGTDPSGAAGIQADLQVIRDHGHYGVSVITAVLAQNTSGVRAVYPMSAAALAAQLDAVFDDFDVAVVKVGLVPDDDLADVVLDRTRGRRVVWDPVLASGDGSTSLFTGTPRELLRALRHVDVLTPNVPELGQLIGAQIRSRDDAHRAAGAVSLEGAAILLKVGHLPHQGTVSDIWAEAGVSSDLDPLPTIEADVRGTGCQLSTAIACQLADGHERRDAGERARAYLNALLNDRAQRLGRGRSIIVR